MKTRRTVIKQGALGAATLATATAMPWRILRAQAKPVKIAVICPLSRPLGAPGHAGQTGRRNRRQRNQRGGRHQGDGRGQARACADRCRRLAEKAKNAAQRLVAQEPDVVGGMGAWLSTFTLAITEVTERAQIPWLTLSYADSITGRGFKYVFASSIPAGQQPAAAMPTILELAKKATGKAPKTAGIIGDNTASPVAFLKPMREGGMEKLRHQGIDGRDLHAAAVGRDAADPEGALERGRNFCCSSRRPSRI